MKGNKFLIILLFCCSIHSQTIIKGAVKDVQNNAIPYANIALKDSLNAIISYTYSLEDGNYSFTISNKGSFNLSFSSMGYKVKTIPIIIKSETKEIIKNILLDEDSFELDEIIVQSEKAIKVKKDTIEVKVNRFLSQNDVTVEDLLKKIPGVSVDSEGVIKIGNQEIEKLMVDGDDFFDKGYKILSKNMPPDQLEKIQILQKYSNNKLLKGIEESDKVALNLVLKDNAKRQWFGNISIGNNFTAENRYHLKSYLMNFGKKNKYILLSNFNNTGYDATGDIRHLIKPIRFNEPASIGDDQQINNLINLATRVPNFKKSRVHFNNAELISLNAIFNPTKKLKIKTLGFFNSDERDFFKNIINEVNVNDANFTNIENSKYLNKKEIAFGKLDLIYSISKTKVVEATTKYNTGNFNDSSNLVFNGNSTLENLQHKNSLLDQKLTFTNKFNDKNVFLLTGRFIKEESPQNYKINQFFYEDLFPASEDVNNVTQTIKNKMQFVGFNAHLLNRKENDDLLELQIGNEYRKDNLLSEFNLLEDNTVFRTPLGYQNETSYSVNNLYFKTKYLLKFNKFDVFTMLDFHQLSNNLNIDNSSIKQNPFFINPSIGFNWEINSNNKINTSYSYNTTNAKALDVFSDFILTGFRSFSKGTGGFNQLNASNLTFNYELGNWSDRFFANTSIVFNKNYDFFSSNTVINQNFAQSKKILIKDRAFLQINTSLNYYFKSITSNLTVDLGFVQSEFKNIINNLNLRTISFKSYNYGFELSSGFRGIFNYDFGTKWKANKIETTISNSFTDNVSYLNLSFIFNKNLDFQLETERYYFGNLEKDNTYYFLDFSARQTIIKNKLTLSLSGKNLFNTEKFKNFSISDIGSSTTEYRLVPRFVLLKLEYRF